MKVNYYKISIIYANIALFKIYGTFKTKEECLGLAMKHYSFDHQIKKIIIEDEKNSDNLTFCMKYCPETGKFYNEVDALKKDLYIIKLANVQGV